MILSALILYFVFHMYNNTNIHKPSLHPSLYAIIPYPATCTYVYCTYVPTLLHSIFAAVGIYSEFLGGRGSDRTDRMEVEQQDGEGATRLEELEQINADLQEQNQDLKEQTTRLQVCTSSCKCKA